MKQSNVTKMLQVVAVVAFLAVIVPVSADTAPECPDGWIEKISRCYYFSNTTADWYTAWSTCSALRSHLYSVDSRAERDNVNGYINRYVSAVKNWWTSGSNLHMSGDWAWYGTMREVVYEDFCSESVSVSNNIGQCLALSSSCDYAWTPVDCLQNTLLFICEKDANLAPKI